jgi:hypothetical protein
MYSIRLPFTDTTLLLSLPGGDLPGPARFGVLCLVLLACLVPIALVIWLYRYELRLVRRVTALRLLGLRLLLVLLLLAVICLQPIVAHSTTVEHSGRVVIAVDRSASMDATDPQRTALEKVRLARAFNLCTDRQLDDWTQRYDEKTGQMRWVGSDEFPGDEKRRAQLTEERRRPFDEVCQRVDALTRAQVAHRLLAADGGRLLTDLRARQDVELIGFDREAWEAPDRLDELFQRQPADAKAAGPNRAEDAAARLTAAYHTDLNQPLLRAEADRGKVLGIVLLTDGRHNTGPLPDKKARELGERKVPIYPIALGARRSPPDVALVKVEAPAGALQDVEVQVKAQVKVSGLDKQKIVVAVHHPGQPPDQNPLGQATVEHTGKDNTYTVPVVIRLSEPGKQTFMVTARPAAHVQEARADNNSRPVTIQVGGDHKPKVLLVDGEARWEYHYLATALLRDPTFQVERVLFEPPLINPRATDEYLERMGNPLRALPADPDALRAYDCIVLGDVDPKDLPRAERLRLEKYVKDYGKTLILVAGKRFLPQAYLQEQAGGDGAAPKPDGGKDANAQGDPLVKMLPIEEPHVLSPARGFRRRPTGEAQLVPFMQMGETPAQSDRLWQELPPHFWAMVGRAKPAASVLAYVPDEAQAWKDLLAQVQAKWPGLQNAGLDAITQGKADELVGRIQQRQEPEVEQFVGEVTRFAGDEWAKVKEPPDRDRAWKQVLEQVEAKWPRLKDAGLEKAGPGDLKDLGDRVRRQQKRDIEQFVEEARARIQRTQEREQPLLVRQNYGFGRVLYLALDSTWRWRYKVGDQHHHRFWGQVIHWAAADKPPLRFGAGSAVYRPGQDVDLFVRLGEDVVRAWPAKVEVGARIVRLADPGKAEESVALVPLTGDVKGRELTGLVRDLPVGTYAIELAVSDPALAGQLLGPLAGAGKDKMRVTFTVLPPDTAETAELAADWDQLQRLAGESHGKVLMPENASEVLNLLTKQTAVQIDRPERKLWQWWPTLIAALLLVTAEWVGRKLAGLP